MTTITVDPAYTEAAARRAQLAEPDQPRHGGAVLAMVIGLLGLLAVVAAKDTQRRAPEVALTRSGLVGRIERLVDQTDRESLELDRLRQEHRAELVRTRDLTGEAARSAERLRLLELEVGAAAVRGPGVVVRMADAADGRAGDDARDGRVQDRDVQDVVNGLWSAGAEAVAINGQRLGALTAIRQAGDSILVDYRPVAPPYDISAVGDPNILEPAFVGSDVAGRFRTWTQLYGLGFSVRRADSLDLPAVGSVRVSHAVPLSEGRPPGGGPAS